MPDQRRFVIVGAGLAGAKAAETLRAEGFEGAVTLIGEEQERPYERPPLSKGLLIGSANRESAYVHPPTWYDEQGVELRTGTRASAVDPGGHVVELDTGEVVGYDRLLLATGAVARSLPLPGASLDRVFTLRTLADSDRISAAIGDGVRVVVIGAGWIGLEVAAAARDRDAEVTVVEVADLPLQRVLGDELGGFFAEVHRRHGVDLRLGAQVAELRGDGRVSAVLLADGTELPADVVLVAVGARPLTELAARADLSVGDGILVDAHLRTDNEDIFAAGDVASVAHPSLGRRIRVEHWSNALHTGPAAARAMLGHRAPYDRMPYFYTDQFSGTPAIGMEYVGYVEPGEYDRVIYLGDPTVLPDASSEFIAFWTAGGRVLAAMNVNVWDVQESLQSLVRAGHAGTPVDPAALADPQVPLPKLLT